MWVYVFKTLITAILVVLIAEISKRWTFLGAIIASLPLTSVLALIWLYVDTQNVQKIQSLSQSIFWVVIPSLVLFALLPWLLKWGWSFWPSLAVSCVATAVSYWFFLRVLKAWGVEI